MSTRSQQARVRAAAIAAEQKAAARRKQTLRITAAATGLLVVAGLATVAAATREEGESAALATAGTTEVRDTPPPWPVQPDGLAQRISGLAFPPVGDESYHAHTLLSVYRDGQQVEVPANVGFDRTGAHSSLHTHTPDGVIHMEADDPYPYTLGELFTVWGVALDTTAGKERLGADTATGDKTVHVFVNGKPAPAGADVPMRDGDNIVVAYGSPGSFPTAPPTTALQGA